MEVIAPLIVFLVIAGLVAGVIWLLVRGWGELQFSSIVTAYTAIVIAISVLVIAGGVHGFFRAAIAELGGRDFSYFAAKPVDYSDRELRDDVADGIVFCFIGVIILILHWFLGSIVRRRTIESHQRGIDRIITLAMTLVGAVGFLIAGGVGLSRLLRRTILETDLQPFESPPQPGDPLAWAIVFGVLWAGFGLRLWRELSTEV